MYIVSGNNEVIQKSIDVLISASAGVVEPNAVLTVQETSGVVVDRYLIDGVVQASPVGGILPVGQLLANVKKKVTIDFKVVDILQLPYSESISISGDLIDSNPANNFGLVEISLSGPSGSIQGNDSANLFGDIVFSGCANNISEVRLVGGSEVNGSVIIDGATGKYGVYNISDLSQDVSFQVELFCDGAKVGSAVTYTVKNISTSFGGGGGLKTVIHAETFGPLTSGNAVTMAGTPTTGSKVLAFRNGPFVNESEYSVNLKTYTFNDNFSVPVGSGAEGEFVTLVYTKTIS